MMSTVALLRDRMQHGLSVGDLKVANAILYARFRGLFTGVTKEVTRNGDVCLMIWGALPRNHLLFRLLRRNGRYAAIDEASDTVFEASKLEDLLEEVRKHYGPSMPL